jgi:uncharacterized protein
MSPLPLQVELELTLDEDEAPEALRARAAKALGVPVAELPELYLLRRSIDARRGRVRLRLSLALGADPHAGLGAQPLREVAKGPPVLVVGDGPAGLFCAWELARHGVPAVVLERGKPVQPRRKDLKGLNQHGVVDADSNYCFGEGGAGTYSDGKLYTRATKRGHVADVLGILVKNGAPAAILTDARPHIGSNKLPKVVTAMREALEGVGVAFRFGAKVSELLTKESGAERRVVGVQLEGGERLVGRAVVLATGHSARGVWHMLRDLGAQLEAKAFALGVRIEHPQPLINDLQYGRAAGHEKLPAAAYRVAETVEERGVFSFCMCPGGFVVPAATDPGALVVNGMSLSRRDSPFANSGLVVQVEPSDLFGLFGEDPFAGVELQRRLEEAAWLAGGQMIRAPATRASDFVRKRASSTSMPTSYQPGLTPTDLAEVLDAAGLPLANKVREALLAFERRMPGYAGEDAVLIGVESRTSAPVRVVRDAYTREAPGLAGLYPTGEGAGFAGGIVSAALDGMATARAIVKSR